MAAQHSSSFVLQLLTALVEQGALSKQEAVSIEKTFSGYTKGQIDYFLLDEGLISQEQLLQALSVVYQVPSYDVRGHFFETQMLKMFPQEILIEFEMIPLTIEDDILIMVAGNPSNEELLAVVGNHVTFDVEFNVGLRQDIIDAIEEYYEISVAQEEQEEDEVDENFDPSDEDIVE